MVGRALSAHTATPEGRPQPWTRAQLAGCAAITLVGLIVRLIYTAKTNVPSHPDWLVNFDPIWYHRQADHLARGMGFISAHSDAAIPSAEHPPLLGVILSLFSRIGLRSFETHRYLTALFGTAVVPVMAALGRRVAGWRVGLAAAALAAVTPFLFANDGQLMPESLYLVFVTAALLFAYRAWDAPHWRDHVILGALIGLAALCRGEGLLLAPFLGIPLGLRSPGVRGWWPRLRIVLIVGGAALLIIAPWTAYNLRRFNHPVLIATSADTAFAGANCAQAYAEHDLGYWSVDCVGARSDVPGDESDFSVAIRRKATTYLGEHVNELPKVVTARILRMWNLMRTSDGVMADSLQNRPKPVTWAGIVALAVLAPLAAWGAVQLRRRGRPTFPLALMPVMVSVVAAGFYGNARFRIPADLAIIALAACGLALRRPPSSRVAADGSSPAPVQG
jgi:4-amino-4-deoxy-L-arabinose transferase-like glycosyltransferase